MEESKKPADSAGGSFRPCPHVAGISLNEDIFYQSSTQKRRFTASKTNLSKTSDPSEDLQILYVSAWGRKQPEFPGPKCHWCSDVTCVTCVYSQEAWMPSELCWLLSPDFLLPCTSSGTASWRPQVRTPLRTVIFRHLALPRPRHVLHHVSCFLEMTPRDGRLFWLERIGGSSHRLKVWMLINVLNDALMRLVVDGFFFENWSGVDSRFFLDGGRRICGFVKTRLCVYMALVSLKHLYLNVKHAFVEVNTELSADPKLGVNIHSFPGINQIKIFIKFASSSKSENVYPDLKSTNLFFPFSIPWCEH